MRKAIFIILITLSSLIYGQTQPNQSAIDMRNHFPDMPKSPTASKFKQYGDVENNEYTGTNSPKIDLHELKVGKIEFPLTLNYVSGNGIKVIDEASNVGLGWEIPLPIISQSVYGYDDLNNGFVKYRCDFAKSNVPYMNPFPHTENWINQPTGFAGLLPGYDTFGYFRAFNYVLPRNGFYIKNYPSSGIKGMDTEPDAFIANIFGERIEFIINNFPTHQTNIQTITNPTFKVLNNNDIYKINYSNGNFIITNAKGISYHFEKKEIMQNIHVMSKKHVLTKIVDSNNETINVLYDEILNVNNIPQVGASYNVLGEPTTSNIYFGGPGGNTLDHAITLPVENSSYFAQATTINSEQNVLNIKEMNGSFGKIVFELSNRIDYVSKKIDFIKIYDFRNVLVKTINFNYDYFLSNSISNSYTAANGGTITFSEDRFKKRLKLNEVVFNATEKYKFEYDQTLLPSKTSYAVDYWGYSNGANSNTSFKINPNDFNLAQNHPLIQSLITNPSVNTKTPNIYYLQSALLKRIIYPTSGYSDFFYENNTADNLFYINQNYKYNTGHGLRLESQINYDANGDFKGKTKYEYIGGKSITPFFLFKETFHQFFLHWVLCASYMSESPRVQKYSFSSNVKISKNNMIPTHSFASHVAVGYNKIVKKTLDSQGVSLGRIESEYQNEPNIIFPLIGTEDCAMAPAVKGSNIENGSLLKSSIYNHNNVIVQEKNNFYNVSTSTFQYGIVSQSSVKVRYTLNCYPPINGVICCDPVMDEWAYFSYYPIYSSKTKLTAEKVTEYFTTGSKWTMTEYFYDANNIPTGKRIRDQFGSTFYEEYSSMIPNNSFLLAKNILNLPLYQGVNEYDNVKSYKRYFYHLNSSNLSKIEESIQGNLYDVSVVNFFYDLYDDKNNLIQYRRENGVSTALIWGYNKTLPIAKIENATIASISSSLITAAQTASNTGTEASLEIALSSLRNALPNAMVTTYTHKPLIGVSTITDSKGDKITYTYDSSGRLINVKDKNGNIISESEYHFKL